MTTHATAPEPALPPLLRKPPLLVVLGMPFVLFSLLLYSMNVTLILGLHEMHSSSDSFLRACGLADVIGSSLFLVGMGICLSALTFAIYRRGKSRR